VTGDSRAAVTPNDVAAALSARVESRNVPEEISESWRRSSALGLRPDRFEVSYEPDVDDDASILRAAGPVLDQLEVDLGRASVGIVLTDKRGQVLGRRAPSTSLNARLDAVMLAEGFVYGEQTVGTNGIGTALARKRPTKVEGTEHFADVLTSLACAAAPVADPASGHVLGVLDLTCAAADASPLMLPFAIHAAREIEQRLLDDSGITERLIIQRLLHERRTAKGPVVLLTGHRVTANSAADRLVNAVDEPALRECAAALLHRSGKDSAVLVLHGGIAVVVTAEPILDGRHPIGSVLRLKPIDDGRSARSDRRARTFGWESLTNTEISVTELVAHGLTNREAAQQLFMSPHTVGFHLRSIYRKLDVTSRIDLTRLFVERNARSDDSFDS
jgi:transcriptional regulator of acetoin/glycerol metabolism/DNA-binding CsgD family transcriptional regulator